MHLHFFNSSTYLSEFGISSTDMGGRVWDARYFLGLNTWKRREDTGLGRRRNKWMLAGWNLCQASRKFGRPVAYQNGLPWWLSGKESACNAGDIGSIPGLGRCPGEGNGYPLQYSSLENPSESWWAPVNGVAKELDTT